MFVLHCCLCCYRFSYCVILGFVFYISWFFTFFLGTGQEIGWEEHPRNDLFCVECVVRHLLNQSINQSVSQSVGQSINQSGRTGH